MKRILFIAQNLERTGSEMVLWYLFLYLNRTEFDPYVFCIKKGELYNQLPGDIKKNTTYKASKKLSLKLFRGVLKFVGIDPLEYQLKKIQANFKADFWYVNTLAIPQIHPIAKRLNIKVVTHFHEYLFAYTFIKFSELRDIIDFSYATIGCSGAVCEKLIELGHPNVKLQYSFIDENRINVNKDRVQELKAKHGISGADFVWVISGKTTYLKGIDLVLLIMGHFKNDENIKILWIGGKQDTGLDYYVNTIAQRKYCNKLIFTDAATDDYYNYFSIGDGYLSLSREECLSLSMLEAAYLGKPIVSFSTGIARQFVKPGMGVVVNVGNIDGIIQAMNELRHNKNYDIDLIKEAAQSFTIKSQMPKFTRLLSEL
jgi:glycosyltransferase involved in cell wall biosynthesis